MIIADNIDNKLKILVNLTRYLGEKTNRNLFFWEYDGLTVFVDDNNRLLLALYNDQIVCSDLLTPALFVDGPWWGIIEEQLAIANRAYLETLKWRKEPVTEMEPAGE